MADKELVNILKQGSEVWNKWRSENYPAAMDSLGDVSNEMDFRNADLSKFNLTSANLLKADLSGAILCEANLSGADLKGSNLWYVDLTGANLAKANLGDVYLSEADLRRANLRKTYLIRANLSSADLTDADLEEAILVGADLSRVELTRAKLWRTVLGNTTFGDTDLSKANDLEMVLHSGPSTIGINTIQRSKGKIPREFLRGCGLSDVDIEYAKLASLELSNQEISTILYRIYDLRATQAIQNNSLFISYCHQDSAFVDELEKHLDEKGIRFWRDIRVATAGRLEKVVDQAIRQNPIVLLILSENSVKSDRIEYEARTARELEKELGRDVICPVALDDAWKDCHWPARLREQIMEYHILDFSNWQDDAEFAKMFRKLVDGLDLFYKIA